jgi:L-fuconolactonase
VRVDAHQHYWSVRRGDYGWLTPALAPLYRDFGPTDLAPELQARGIMGTVLVQAAPTLAETHYLLDLAARTPSVLGVVGWVDLAGDEALAQLEALSAHPKFRGVRPMLQDLPDEAWIARAPIDAALHRLTHLGLRWDALVRSRHLPHLLARVERHPELPVVIDHAAKPDIAGGEFEVWRARLAPLARFPQVYCKLSGLLTEAPPDSGFDVLKPYVDSVLELFGPARVMWGSDWPVLNLASSYGAWARLTDRLLEPLDAGQREAVLGGAAARFYRLSPPTQETA